MLFLGAGVMILSLLLKNTASSTFPLFPANLYKYSSYLFILIFMFNRTDFRKDESGIVCMTAMLIFGGLFLIIGIIAILFITNLVVSNIIPIAIGIILIICLPIATKGWYYSKTGKEYSKGGK